VEGGMGKEKGDVNDYRVRNETAKDEAWICKENQYVDSVLSLLLLVSSSLQNLYLSSLIRY
jgi:threonyl-tRNA synthetase